MPGQPGPPETTLQRMTRVFSQYRAPVIRVGDRLGDLGIDSLRVLELVVDLEAEFHVGLDFESRYRDPPAEELGEMVWRRASIGDLVQVIDRTLEEHGH